MHVSLPNEFSAPRYQRAAHGSWLQADRFRSLSGLLRRCGLFGLLLTITVSYAKAGSPIRYVKPGGTGDGFTWANASGDLQAMINATGAGGQVWVAAGTYTPTYNSFDGEVGLGKTFQMKAGVKIYGGFVGNETTVNERPTTRPSSSTLSGSGAGIYHVVYSTGLDNTALLDGFVITGGTASGTTSYLNEYGGGMLNYGSSPTLNNISFVKNSASNGGGMYSEGSPRLSNVSFVLNRASGGGGGMFSSYGTPILTNVSFVQNQATQSGGGIRNESSSPTLTNVSFVSNSAPNGGGILCSFSSAHSLVNCVFWNNGGANTIKLDEDGVVTASYCLMDGGVQNYNNEGNVFTTNTNPFASATDVTLVAGSVAINGGDIAAYSKVSGPTTDLAGKPRFRILFGQPTIDMGAVQYQPVGLTLQASGPTAAVCVGSPASLSVEVSSGTAPYSYTWVAPVGTTLSATNTQRVTATPTATGVQTLTVLVADNSSPALSGSATVALTVDGSPDYLPLVDLYNATNGASWNQKNGWLSSCDPCNGLGGRPWVGVTCANGRVTQLRLSYNYMNGTIPASLSALTKLTDLDLTGNYLSGTLPASLSALTDLQTLKLSGNQLNGSIPAGLSALTSLTDLQLQRNQLTGNIPASLSTLTKLQGLYLSGNQLTGAIPASLSTLTKLTDLDLTENQLSGSIPTSLSALTKLQRLFLSNNQLTGSIPASLSALTELLGLNLGYNQLSGSIPSGLGTLPKLNELDLSSNQLTGCLPSTLKNLCNRSIDATISNNPGLPSGGNWSAFCSGAPTGNCVITLQTSATPNPVFAGSTATLSVTPSGATAPYSYTWAAPPGITLGTSNQAQTAAQIPAGTSGVLTFTITVADATPLYSTSLVTLTVTAASPATQTACRNTQVVLNSGLSGVRYEWYRGGKTAASKLIDVKSVQQGTTTSSLTLVMVQTNATYYCKVFGANGSFEWAGPFALTVTANCGGRVGADEPGAALQVLVAPNPLEGGWLRAVVSGAAGQALQVQVVDLAGQSVRSQQWGDAQAQQAVEWDLSAQPAGVYLLQVRTQSQSQTLRIIKP